MPIATTYDISEITESLVKALSDANNNSPMWTKNGGTIVSNYIINITSSSPDSVRTGKPGDCQLNLYLMHLNQSPYLRNTPILGSSAMSNTQQPLTLELTYLLTAFAEDNADREQQAMSIALQAFYQQPISTATGQYLTITQGSDTLEEMSRLWQSFTVAYRCSAVFRVAVALITPTQAPDRISPNPKTIDITVAPAIEPLSSTPQLFGPSRSTTTTIPSGSTDPNAVVLTAGPATAVAGAQLRIGGQGLSGPQANTVFLGTLDGTTTWTITPWRVNATLESELELNLPAAYAIAPAPAPPASLPTPGVYLLSVGSTSPASRSPAIPLVVVPQITNVASPPILPATAGIYTITGAGFVPAATQVYVGATSLTPLTSAPTAAGGGFQAKSDGTSVSFALPPNQPHGLTSVRIRVDGVDAPPAWQLQA
jgi:Pvc16 N-terminal domain